MAATDVATLFLDTEQRINRFTPRLAQIFNVVPGDEGRPITDITHRLEYEDLTVDAKRVLADLSGIERTIKSRDDRWFLLRIRPYRTLDDRIEGVVVTFVDVTEQRESEQRWQANQQLLLDELTHRIKNTHTVVQAISQMSLRDSGASSEARDALEARLSALAKSHELLVQNQWRTVSLSTLVRGQLGGLEQRVQLSGPNVDVPARAATTLGLMIHELATNAVKYGSLGSNNGHVDVSWTIETRSVPSRLRLRWQEVGGPPVGQPGKRGFGSVLLEKGIEGVEISREFKKPGLICTIEFPLGK
jgi:two-component system CheB/CheR fusion protein